MKYRLITLILCLLPSINNFAQCWQNITVGNSHSLAIKTNGTLWSWGDNHVGQLGDGTNTDKNIPTQVDTNSVWQKLVGGSFHSLAIKADETLWAWGVNDSGQLGDGTTVTKNTLVQIGTDSNWQNLAAGRFHSLAIKIDGTLWAWGANSSGQLGDDSYFSKTSPVQVGTDSNWQSVAAGSNHSLAIKADGTLWAWGANDDGQLGDSTNVDKGSPVQIGTEDDWQNVIAGRNHSLAIKANGTLWAWGWNASGQLGDGTIGLSNGKTSPIQIGTDNNWLSVTAGDIHSLGIKADGTLWAWGDNQYGQLGDGTIGLSNGKTSPVQIGIDSDWEDLAAGDVHSLAIKVDGTLWAWGSNSSGQLGDGTNVEKTNPVEVLCSMVSVTYDKLKQEAIKIYPNPSMSFVYIDLLELNGVDLFIEISSLSGQVVVPQQILLETRQINIKSLPTGLYLLTMSIGNMHLTKSFIKK